MRSAPQGHLLDIDIFIKCNGERLTNFVSVARSFTQFHMRVTGSLEPSQVPIQTITTAISLTKALHSLVTTAGRPF